MRIVLWLTVTLCLPAVAAASEWTSYGGDPGGQKYSPLDQITAGNVDQLDLAWSYQTGELDEHPDRAAFASFNGTPIILPEAAGRSLVFCTPFNKIVALDPQTGEERWRFDSEVDKGPFPTRYNCRGIGYWADKAANNGQDCKHRLFMGTTDLRIFSIDAITGLACNDFGERGAVNMLPTFRAGYPDLAYGDATFSSPPAIVGDLVVFGSSNNVRNTSVASPVGTVHAFDARTGDIAWTFDPIPYDEDDPEHGSWTPDALAVTTGANAWSMLSVDEARNLIFVPTGSASPDPYGGLRPGDNRYANSVVALRGSTGEVVWHFQTIHHDVWDWDLPAQPMLVDINRGEDIIPAVVQLTKQGLVFTLHRETGVPIFEVEERPVPQDGAVPGEQLSPTQPFPVKPEPLIETGFTPDDAWGMTFWDKGKCRDMVAAGDYGPLFSPPTLKGRVGMPGMSVTNWGGGAYDPATNTLITTASRAPMKLQLFKAEDVPPPKPGPPVFGAPKLVKGTEYGLATVPLLSPFFMPCSKPPWGQLVSIDLGTGEIEWKQTLGTLDTLAPIPIPLKWGTPTSGGPMVTGGGLIFIGATMDEKFRAFDLETGEEVWKVSTPTSSMASPMTYSVDGEQYVVIASGGHMWQYSQKLGDWLLAYKLGRELETPKAALGPATTGSRSIPDFHGRNAAMRQFLHNGVLAATAFALTVIGGCAEKPEDDSRILRIAIPDLPRSSKNPFGSTSLPALYTYAAIFDALTYLDETGTLQPALALSWEQRAPEVWRFKLRPETTFSNGEPFTATAVLRSIEYIKSAEAAGFTVATILASITNAQVVDDLTIDVTTSRPNIFLPRELSDLRIVAPSAWRFQDGHLSVAEPIGTGPFAVEFWGPSTVRLRAFQESWRPPRVDRLELTVVKDPAARTQALQSGAVHIALTLAPETGQELATAGNTMKPVLHSSVIALSFITTQPGPLQDVRVRRALNYAVNKQELTSLFIGGAVDPATQFVVPTAFGYDPGLEPYSYDPKRARALLKEAGLSDGFAFTLEAATGGSTNSAAVNQQIATYLKAVGVDMEVRSIPINQLSRNMHEFGWKGSAFEMNYGAHPSLDALNVLRMHSCAWPNPWYCDQQVMPMLEGALSTNDLDTRRERTQQIMRRYHDQAPGILLWQIAWFVGLDGGVGGFEMDNGHIRYHNITLQ